MSPAAAPTARAGGMNKTINERTAALPRPPQPGDMTATDKRKEPPQSGGNDRKQKRRGDKSRNTQDPPDKSLGRYTPRQQERIREGLRIWARVAIRSYLRQRTGEPHTGTEPAAEEES